jgi:outer membrane immunogenic protein
MTLKSIKAGVATLALCVATMSAEAADMPVKAPYYKAPLRSVVAYYNWTGLYAGFNVGYGFGSSSWTGAIPVDLSPKGMLYGLTVGYNWQAGSFVYGLEGDYSWSMVKASDTCGILLTCETSNTYLATGRARLGYAFDRFMPYLTGGVAYGDIKADISPTAQSASKAKLGYTFGGGIEYAFLGNWTAKAEYLYVDLGSFDTGFAPLTGTSVDFKENIVRAGLNYKFGGSSSSW